MDLNPSRLAPNPRTLRERKANTKILEQFNKDHTDDFFATPQTKTAANKKKPNNESKQQQQQQQQQQQKAEDIMNNLFEESGDSDNNLSNYSARTPIGTYLSTSSRSVSSSAAAVSLAGRDSPKVDEDKQDAYIHRTMRDNKKLYKLWSTKAKSPMIFDLGDEDEQQGEVKAPLHRRKLVPPEKPVMKMISDVERFRQSQQQQVEDEEDNSGLDDDDRDPEVGEGDDDLDDDDEARAREDEEILRKFREQKLKELQMSRAKV